MTRASTTFTSRSITITNLRNLLSSITRLPQQRRLTLLSISKPSNTNSIISRINLPTRRDQNLRRISSHHSLIRQHMFISINRRQRTRLTLSLKRRTRTLFRTKTTRTPTQKTINLIRTQLRSRKSPRPHNSLLRTPHNISLRLLKLSSTKTNSRRRQAIKASLRTTRPRTTTSTEPVHHTHYTHTTHAGPVGDKYPSHKISIGSK